MTSHHSMPETCQQMYAIVHPEHPDSRTIAQMAGCRCSVAAQKSTSGIAPGFGRYCLATEWLDDE